MTSKPILTTHVDQPFRALLEGGPAVPGETVNVRDHAIVGGRCVVRNAHREGYWHVPAATARAADMSAVLTATFEPDPTISFSSPAR